jgi:hypothetical protein
VNLHAALGGLGQRLVGDDLQQGDQLAAIAAGRKGADAWSALLQRPAIMCRVASMAASTYLRSVAISSMPVLRLRRWLLTQAVKVCVGEKRGEWRC